MFHLYPLIRTPEDTIMSGNISTDFLVALKEYLEGPTVDGPGQLGQLQGRADFAAETLAQVIEDPGYAWLAADTFTALAKTQEARNAQITRTLDDTPTA